MPPSTETSLRIHELDDETPWGQVCLGIDIDGSRHLLVPIASRTPLRTGLEGPGLSLRKRNLEDDDRYTTYADLACHRSELAYLFDDFCDDVLRELAAFRPLPMKAVYQVVDRWRSMFDRPLGVLTDEAAKGLYTELLVLRRLLARDPSAHRMWVGPRGASHDFHGGDTDLEVKATTVPVGRHVRIHGLDQLEPTHGSTLLLAWFRLTDTRQSGTGESLIELTELALELTDDEPAVRDLLAAAGYLPGTLDTNDGRRYVIADERWYVVDNDLPRLTRAALARADVPETVTDVDYTIDLTAEPPTPLHPSDVDRFVGAMGVVR